jgi:hypothetical protein
MRKWKRVGSMGVISMSTDRELDCTHNIYCLLVGLVKFAQG